jgi:prepilin-type N-terminal cleavage/methylation domain-containing protein
MHTERNVARRAAFTLVELLVVIAIIALMAGMLTPAIIAALNKAHAAATISRIRECEVAATAFFNDYGDYPPTHWSELPAIFKYDDSGRLTGLGTGSYPSTVNEGIEVFFACLATQKGGAYLDADQSWLRNVDWPDDTNAPADADTDPDGDYDNSNNDVATATNWYLGSNQIFELVDWWGNPLVYFHSRDYTSYDGWYDNGTPDNPGDDYWAAPSSGHELMWYADAQANLLPCYARSVAGFTTLNYPRVDSYQLYSWGKDQLPGRSDLPTVTPDTVPFPGGRDAGQMPGWTGQSGNLTNWEE